MQRATQTCHLLYIKPLLISIEASRRLTQTGKLLQLFWNVPSSHHFAIQPRFGTQRGLLEARKVMTLEARFIGVLDVPNPFMSHLRILTRVRMLRMKRCVFSKIKCTCQNNSLVTKSIMMERRSICMNNLNNVDLLN